MAEHVFLNEDNIYVSNTRVILSGTRYATANLTSVAKRFTPASKGCAMLLTVLAVCMVLGSLEPEREGDSERPDIRHGESDLGREAIHAREQRLRDAAHGAGRVHGAWLARADVLERLRHRIRHVSGLRRARCGGGA